jgi:hypothetical protein
MPSENKSTCSTVQACGEPAISGLQSGTATATSGQYLTSNALGISNWISGTTSTSYITADNGTYNSPVGINDQYRFPKDGEVRIDPETGDSSIYLSDYNKWVECDILELRKIKDENGNQKSIISVSYEMSVVQIKQKQQERKVLIEKVQKYKPLEFITSGYINIIGGTGGAITIGQQNQIYINTPATVGTGGYLPATGGYVTTPYIAGVDPIWTTTTTATPYNVVGGTYYNTNDMTLNIITDTAGTSQTINLA